MEIQSMLPPPPLLQDLIPKEESSTLQLSESIFEKYKNGKAPLSAPFRLFETNSNTSCD